MNCSDYNLKTDSTHKMSYSLEEKIRLFGVFSRVGIILIQFLTNLSIPDHKAGVFQKPLEITFPKSDLDRIIELTFGGLTRWDAQYFLHIAEYGYTYENTLAFFPLFPLVIRQISYFLLKILSIVFNPFFNITGVISLHSVLILVSVTFNNVIFIKTAVILYKLSLLVLKSEKLAYISAVLFCINPASIFFSACYSESLFCYLVFYGLLKIEEKNSFINYVILGMTGTVRSNGIINIGFMMYKYLKLRCFGKVPFFYDFIFNFGIILSLLPFLTYQFYCYAKFCLPNKVTLPDFIYSYGLSNDFVFPGSNSTWCGNTIPFAYSYVQKHYWNVGFLNYYELKQIPNFLLAAPMIYIMIQGTWTFVRHYKLLILYLGMVQGDSGDELPISVFPYIVHGFALTVFAVFVIHVQVATRLLASSSPLPYWYCARVMAMTVRDSLQVDVLKKMRQKGEYFYESLENKKSNWKTFLFTETFTGYSFFIKWYFLLYFFVGTLMFSNYLPWT